MKRITLLALTTALLAVAGCSEDKAPPQAGETALPTASASAEAPASPSASPSPAINFTVDGAGPYQLGATLTALQTAGQIAEAGVPETCPMNTNAKGTGVWKDINLSFRPDGKLHLVVNRSKDIPTPSGAWIGMTLASLSSIYGNLGEELALGPNTAYLVTTNSGRGMLFDLDPSKKVFTMIAGDAKYLKDSYLGGTDFC
jgi:hypothetical protein